MDLDLGLIYTRTGLGKRIADFSKTHSDELVTNRVHFAGLSQADFMEL